MPARTVAGLDIGTHEVRAVIADVSADAITARGWGSAATSGMRKGEVVHTADVADAVSAAMSEASGAAGMRPRRVHLCVSGRSVRSARSSGAVALRGGEITAVDKERALECARAVCVPVERHLLHVIPAEYAVDRRRGIVEPEGMSGLRLDVTVNLVTVSAAHLESMAAVCRQAGYLTAERAYTLLPKSQALLTAEERMQGIALVDIGAGTTEIACFERGSLIHAAVIGIGGDHLTNDLAAGLGVTVSEAEKIKCGYGSANPAAVSRDPSVSVRRGDEDRAVEAGAIAGILLPRCEEMLSLIRAEIRKWRPLSTIPHGVVMTGGGGRLRGFAELASTLFASAVRTSRLRQWPRIPSGLREAGYAAAFGFAVMEQEAMVRSRRRETGREASIPLLGTAYKRASGYFHNLTITGRKEGGSHV